MKTFFCALLLVFTLTIAHAESNEGVYGADWKAETETTYSDVSDNVHRAIGGCLILFIGLAYKYMKKR